MKYRRLGQTDLKVSVVGIGTWQYGGEWGKSFTAKEVEGILDRGLELGFNLIDTAECYGDHLSESLIGEAVRGSRSKWLLATKFGHKFCSHLQREQIWDAAGVREQLEESLKALQTDYVDLYQFHSGTDEAIDNDALWTMLDKQVEAGKIRHLGVSIGSNENVYQVEQAAKLGTGAIQVVYNRLDRKPEQGVFQACAEHDLGVLARVPLASGFLSGNYKPGAVFGHDDVRASRDREAVDALLRQAAQIRETEVPPGTNMAQWAIAWCLQHPAVSTCIPGFKNIEQLEAAAGAADLELVTDNHPAAWK
ncbi:MAG: aldo/keto reductase [Paenibacillaceae bacterium]|jgi:aryl-alcohol dehydrogenase-like predicted oxidoreductase|nr:aldo/keto reductase [Paenibacillaceae bacterium]